jgi:hypothetical protein
MVTGHYFLLPRTLFFLQDANVKKRDAQRL